MSEGAITIRLSKAATEFNVGVSTIVEFLHKKGHKIDSNPNTKLTQEMYTLLVKEYQPDKATKESSKKIELEYLHHQALSIDDRKPAPVEESDERESNELIIKTFDVQKQTQAKQAAEPVKKPEPVIKPEPVVPEPTPVVEKLPEPVHAEIPEAPATVPPSVPPVSTPEPEPEVVATEPVADAGGPQLKVLGKIDLDQFEQKNKGKKKGEKGGKKKHEHAEVETSPVQ
ncbi:MAG TPA: hypothetical protein PLP88_08695, partial [Bacteroidales bacterium]|nr:hypothetical protein [Bacteroidales bacterium]